MRYTFEFKLFGKKVQMFSERQMGIVVEKNPMLFACMVRMQIIIFYVPCLSAIRNF